MIRSLFMRLGLFYWCLFICVSLFRECVVVRLGSLAAFLQTYRALFAAPPEQKFAKQSEVDLRREECIFGSLLYMALLAWDLKEMEAQVLKLHCKGEMTCIEVLMGWLRLVGSLKLQVSFTEYRLFYRALLQKRPVILRSLLIVATP